MPEAKQHAYDHPFSCQWCSQHPIEDFEHFPDTDDYLMFYPDKKAIHLHFGWATSTAEESTAETEWIYEHTVNRWLPEHPKQKFLILVDMTRSDDSELPSERSIQLYKEMFQHKQNAKTVFYGVTPSMKFFLKMVTRLSRQHDKIVVVNTKEEADKIYREWLAEQ